MNDFRNQIIYIDSAEPKKTADWFRENTDFKVIKKTLPVGDILSENICIERKTTTDLAGSIKERIWRQAANMQQYKHKYLLISGDFEKISNPKSVLGSIASLSVRYGLQICWIPNDTDLFYLASRLIVKHADGKEMQTEFHKKVRKSTDGLSVLMGLPGISEKKARQLLDSYGSAHTVIDIFVRDPGSIAGLSGFGVKSVETARECLLREGKK